MIKIELNQKFVLSLKYYNMYFHIVYEKMVSREELKNVDFIFFITFLRLSRIGIVMNELFYE